MTSPTDPNEQDLIPECDRPPATARWTNDFDGTVVIHVRTRFQYAGGGEWPLGFLPATCDNGKARYVTDHAAYVTVSDVDDPHPDIPRRDDVMFHLHRAFASFGDDANLVIEIHRT